MAGTGTKYIYLPHDNLNRYLSSEQGAPGAASGLLTVQWVLLRQCVYLHYCPEFLICSSVNSMVTAFAFIICILKLSLVAQPVEYCSLVGRVPAPRRDYIAS